MRKANSKKISCLWLLRIVWPLNRKSKRDELGKSCFPKINLREISGSIPRLNRYSGVFAGLSRASTQWTSRRVQDYNSSNGCWSGSRFFDLISRDLNLMMMIMTGFHVGLIWFSTTSSNNLRLLRFILPYFCCFRDISMACLWGVRGESRPMTKYRFRMSMTFLVKSNYH